MDRQTGIERALLVAEMLTDILERFIDRQIEIYKKKERDRQIDRYWHSITCIVEEY